MEVVFLLSAERNLQEAYIGRKSTGKGEDTFFCKI
jgi:hypothetical protein